MLPFFRFTLVLLLGLSFHLSAQKVNIKNHKIYIDDVAVAKLKSPGVSICTNYIIISTLQGVPRFELTSHSLKDGILVASIDQLRSNYIEHSIKATSLNCKISLAQEVILGNTPLITKDGIDEWALEQLLTSKKRNIRSEQQREKELKSVLHYRLYIDASGTIYAGGKTNDSFLKDGKPSVDNSIVGKIEKGSYLLHNQPKVTYSVTNNEGVLMASWFEKDPKSLEDDYLITFTDRIKKNFHVTNTYHNNIPMNKDSLAMDIVRKMYYNGVYLSDFKVYEHKDELKDITFLNLYMDSKGVVYAGGELKQSFKKGENPYAASTRVGDIVRSINKGKNKNSYVIRNAKQMVVATVDQEDVTESGIPILKAVNGKMFYLPIPEDNYTHQSSDLSNDQFALKSIEKLYKNYIPLSSYEESEAFLTKFKLSITSTGVIYSGTKKIGFIAKEKWLENKKELYRYTVKTDRDRPVAIWEQDPVNTKQGTLTILANNETFSVPYTDAFSQPFNTDPLAQNIVNKMFRNSVYLKNSDPHVLLQLLELGFGIFGGALR